MELKFDWLIVLENLRRGIMVTDTTLEGPKSPRIIYVNAAWVKMTGYGRDEIANQTPRMLQGKHTDRCTGEKFYRSGNHPIFSLRLIFSTEPSLSSVQFPCPAFLAVWILPGRSVSAPHFLDPGILQKPDSRAA